MNKVTLRVEVTRINPQQTEVRFFREGNGDDMVEQRADFFEQHIKAACVQMLNCHGVMAGHTAPPATPATGRNGVAF